MFDDLCHTQSASDVTRCGSVQVVCREVVLLVSPLRLVMLVDQHMYTVNQPFGCTREAVAQQQPTACCEASADDQETAANTAVKWPISTQFAMIVSHQMLRLACKLLRSCNLLVLVDGVLCECVEPRCVCDGSTALHTGHYLLYSTIAAHWSAIRPISTSHCVSHKQNGRKRLVL